MDFINYIQFSLNKYDYYRYTAISIIGILLLNRFNMVFSNRNILILCTIGVIVFILIKLKTHSHMNQYKKYTNKLNLVNDKSLVHLNKDIDVVSVYAGIIKYRALNPYAFQISLDNMNEFLRLYNQIKNSNTAHVYIYEAAKYRRINSLNNLLSITLSIPKSVSFLNTEQIDPDIQDIYDIELEKAVKNLEKLTFNYLIKIELIVNNRWADELTYNNIRPIYSHEPSGDPAKDLLYNKHFSIYAD